MCTFNNSPFGLALFIQAQINKYTWKIDAWRVARARGELCVERMRKINDCMGVNVKRIREQYIENREKIY